MGNEALRNALVCRKGFNKGEQKQFSAELLQILHWLEFRPLNVQT